MPYFSFLSPLATPATPLEFTLKPRANDRNIVRRNMLRASCYPVVTCVIVRPNESAVVLYVRIISNVISASFLWLKQHLIRK